MQRTLFICSAVESCQEQSQCCPHKQPHIKDERCIPKLCRYGPRDQEVDCVLADPVTPHVPKAKPEPLTAHLNAEVVSREGDTITELKLKSVTLDEPLRIEEPVKAPEEPIKAPETKKPEPAQRSVTLRNKPERKATK